MVVRPRPNKRRWPLKRYPELMSMLNSDEKLGSVPSVPQFQGLLQLREYTVALLTENLRTSFPLTYCGELD